MSNKLLHFSLLIIMFLSVFSSCEKIEDTTGTLIVNFKRAEEASEKIEIKLYPYEFDYESIGPIEMRVVKPSDTSVSFELISGNYIVHHSVFGFARGVQVRAGESTILNY